MNARRHPTIDESTEGRLFVRTATADAAGAARTRIEFSSWLRRYFSLHEERLADLVLAVNEALANAAEFGYLDSPGHGPLGCTAAYQDDTDVFSVTVTDHGCWRHAEAHTATAPPQYGRRGRGIALMRMLADDTRIDTSDQGTRVVLTWTHLLTPSDRAATPAVVRK